MKELRLTFSTDDFGAISQVLIDRGISFRVEPIMVAEAAAPPARPSPPARGRRRRTVKKPKRAAKSARSATPTGGGAIPTAGAERLREAIARDRAGSGPLGFEPPAPATEEGKGRGGSTEQDEGD